MANKKEGGLIRKNTQYDDLVALDPHQNEDPGMQVLTANEEPDEEEKFHYDAMYADFMDELYDNQTRNAENMLGNSRELFDGVADVAFTILKAVYQRHDQREGPVPQSVVFGEGGIVHTAVDEVFRYAQALGMPGSDDQDQYVAAQINIMKKVGEYVNNKSDDGAVEEAQDLLVDVEMAGGPYDRDPEVSGEDRRELEAVALQNEAIAESAELAQQTAEGGEEMAQAVEDVPPEEMGGLV